MEIKRITKQMMKRLFKVANLVVRGELLLTMKVDKGFPYIVWAFLMAWLTIFIYMKIDYDVLRLESNRKVLNELQIEHAEKTCEIAAFDRMSSINKMLEAQGSELTVPTKPARRLR